MTDKEIKFTEEEMKTISELQQIYSRVQNSLGQVFVSRIRTEQQLNELDTAETNLKNQFTENQTNERNFVDSINK